MSAAGPPVRAVVGVEAAKLRSQRTFLAVLGGCAAGPFALVLALRLQGTPPTDTIFGRQVHDSALAPSLFLLAFGGQWLLPLLCGLVGGDILASEDRHGTWKTLLTRSAGRSQVFLAKAVAAAGWSVLVVVELAVSSLLAGGLLGGDRSLLGLTGQPVTGLGAPLLVLASWACVLPPAIGFACVGLLASSLTRNGAAGVGAPVVLALALTLVSLVPGTDPLRHLLLVTPFSGWHGLLTEPTTYAPLVRGTLVSAGWALGCLLAARAVVLRRDVTGG